MNCRNCSMEIPAGETKCPTCGAVVLDNTASYDNKSSVRTELLLCIFLGVFGAHKFYKGETGLGVLYLCTAGLFYIGWIVDIIKLGIACCK